LVDCLLSEDPRFVALGFEGFTFDYVSDQESFWVQAHLLDCVSYSSDVG